MTTLQRILAEASPTNVRRMCVRAYAFQERVPPSEIQLWNVGDNPTDYGVHKWTERSAVEVLARYEARGNPLHIDIEHGGVKDEDGEPTETGGYARLELRDGAPWLVFDWSEYAVAQISSGRRRFLSPEYDVDRTTGEIAALYCVSLVANPGTHRARMLAAAAINQETGMDPKLAAIMAILKSVTDPAAAIESIKSLCATLDGGGEPGGEPAATGAPDGEPAPGAQTAAAGEEPGDEDDKTPVAAGAGAPAAPVAAGAAPAATPVAAAAAPPAAGTAPVAAARAAAATLPAAASSTVHVAAAAAVVQIENAQRDHLIATQGARLDPSIRRWASAQPLAVVRGLIDATPAELEPAGRVAATRGATHGTAAHRGLEGRDLEELDRQMGTFQASAPEPHTTDAGVLVLPAVPPSVHRERKRVAAAAAALAAGKAGK